MPSEKYSQYYCHKITLNLGCRSKTVVHCWLDVVSLYATTLSFSTRLLLGETQIVELGLRLEHGFNLRLELGVGSWLKLRRCTSILLSSKLFAKLYRLLNVTPNRLAP